jgi:hypothetical protein
VEERSTDAKAQNYRTQACDYMFKDRKLVTLFTEIHSKSLEFYFFLLSAPQLIFFNIFTANIYNLLKYTLNAALLVEYSVSPHYHFTFYI